MHTFSVFSASGGLSVWCALVVAQVYRHTACQHVATGATWLRCTGRSCAQWPRRVHSVWRFCGVDVSGQAKKQRAVDHSDVVCSMCQTFQFFPFILLLVMFQGKKKSSGGANPGLAAASKAAKEAAEKEAKKKKKRDKKNFNQVRAYVRPCRGCWFGFVSLFPRMEGCVQASVLLCLCGTTQVRDRMGNTLWYANRSIRLFPQFAPFSRMASISSS